MSKVLVTGSTGLIGYNIVNALLEQGRDIRVLVRSITKARYLLPDSVEIFKGDITDLSSIEIAMKDCDTIYHIAGFPEQWMKDPSIFHAVNVLGTQNMANAALKFKVKRFIYTSTIDVFYAKSGSTYNESVLDINQKETFYARSKQEADKVVTLALKKGLPAIFLHPSAAFGPGPTDSPGTNDLVTKLYNNEVPVLLPGGYPVCFTQDIASGHLLAETKGKVGERYILSNEYFSLSQISNIILKELNLNKKSPPVLPLALVKVISYIGEKIAHLTNKSPLIPKGQLTFLRWQARPLNAKAISDLGWKPTPFTKAIQETIKFLIK